MESCAWCACSSVKGFVSIEAAIDSFASLGVKVMITELDVDVLPLTREGQIIGTGMSDAQFQLEEFKEYLDPYRNGLPNDV